MYKENGENINGKWKHRDTCVDFKVPSWLPFFLSKGEHKIR